MEKKNIRSILIVAGAFVVALAIVWFVFLSPYAAVDVERALASGDGVRVENGPEYLTFYPDGAGSAGLVFYQGARVPVEAYARFAREIASYGFTVVMPKSPLNLASLGRDAALDAIAAHAEVRSWVVGGHSLGGATACAFVAANPGKAAGLVLVAAYPDGGADLSSAKLPALVVSGSSDAFATRARIESAKRLLPAATHYIELSGANSAHFASYGDQPGDGVATMSADFQVDTCVDQIVKLLRALERANNAQATQTGN